MNDIKYLAPWFQHSGTVFWRYPIKASYNELEWKWRAQIAYRYYIDNWEVVFRRLDSGRVEALGYYNSCQEALDAADIKLLELGYILLTKEQCERLQVLL